jgi:hypothetical protein
MVSITRRLPEFRNFHKFLMRIENLLREEVMRHSFRQWSIARCNTALDSIKEFEEHDISQVFLLLKEVTPEMFFEK